jgi:hypothetical protein
MPLAIACLFAISAPALRISEYFDRQVESMPMLQLPAKLQTEEITEENF